MKYLSRILFFLCFSTFSVLNAKTYYCFPFCNEYEILKILLSELYDFVDFFVVEESCETFRGNVKEYNFEKNQHLYTEFIDKIIYIKTGSKNFSGSVSEQTWAREHWQRNQLINGLENAEDDDVIIAADCDEILSSGTLTQLSSILKQKPTCAYRLPLYLYFLNFYNKDVSDTLCVTATTYKYLKHITFVELRQKRSDPSTVIIDGGGWHFSSMGGFETAYYKSTNWSHWADADWNSENSLHVNGYEHWKKILTVRAPGACVKPIDVSYPQYVCKHIDELVKKGFILQPQ